MSKKQISNKANTGKINSIPNSTKKIKTFLGLIIFVFAFILYARGISNEYTTDDHVVTDQNDLVKKGFEAIPTIFSTDYLYGYNNGLMSGPVYRPASLVMFAIEWQFFPENPYIFHFMNVLLFSITCWLLYLLLYKLIEKIPFSFGNVNNIKLLFPFVCCILYAAHPIHTEVVDNIKSRDEILCFLFGILAIFCFVKSVSKRAVLNLIFGSICFFLSILSKETGITFLIVIPLTLFVFTNSSIRKLVLISIIVIVIAVIYYIIREYVLRNIRLNTGDNNLYNSVVAAPNFISRQATVFYILLRYILLLLFPYNLTCDYNYNMIKIQTLTDIPAIAGILINSGLGIYAVINLRKKSIISYGILFYFITLSPVSNMFIYTGATMAERFMYTPSFGFCIIISYFLIRLTTIKNKMKGIKNPLELFTQNKTLFIIVFCVTILFSIRTISRTIDWKNNLTIFTHDVEISDSSATAHYMVGVMNYFDLYLNEKDLSKKAAYLDKAQQEFLTTIKIYHNYSEAYKNLANIYQEKQDNQSALDTYESLLKFDHTPNTTIFNNLGILYTKTKNYDKALQYLDSALKYYPNYAQPNNNKAFIYLNKAMYPEAIAACEEAIRIDSMYAKPYSYLGCAYMNLGDFQKAFKYFQKSLQLDSTDVECMKFLSTDYIYLGDTANARKYYEMGSK